MTLIYLVFQVLSGTMDISLAVSQYKISDNDELFA